MLQEMRIKAFDGLVLKASVKLQVEITEKSVNDKITLREPIY